MPQLSKARPIEIRGLKYFFYVARAGNLGRASRELGIGQPALTRQIQKLEDGVGAELLVRHSQGVILTDVGSRLLEAAENIISLLTFTLGRNPDLHRGPGSLVIGYPPEVGVLLVPQCIKRFQTERPHVVMNLREDCSNSLTTGILSGQVDVGVAYDPPHLDRLDIRPVLTEPLLVVGSPQSNLRSSDRGIHIRELDNLPLISMGRRQSHYHLLQRAAMRHGLRLQCLMEVDSLLTLKEMLRQGLGYSILPYSAVREEVCRGALCVSPIKNAPISTLAIVLRRNPDPGMELSVLSQILVSQIMKLVKEGIWSGARLVTAHVSS